MSFFRTMAKKFNYRLIFLPSGDQPEAIGQLYHSITSGIAQQTLLGVTGSGKTFTIANLVEKIQRPTLILAPNKTLAAQLYGEMREFFPDNAVEYFVSLLRLLPAGGLCAFPPIRISKRTLPSMNTSNRCVYPPPRPCWNVRIPSSLPPFPPFTAWATPRPT